MPETLPEASVDSRGRAIPLDPDDALRRAERGIHALIAVESMGDEDEQRSTLEALLRALEEERPLFRGPSE